MKGSIQLKNGKWYTVISYKDPRDPPRKSRQKWEATGLPERGNKKAANALLEKRMEAFIEAQRTKDEKLERRLKPAPELAAHREMPFIDYLKLYVETIKDKNTPYNYLQYSYHYMNVYKPFFKDLQLIDITHEEINAFNEYLKERGCNGTTIRNYSNVLRPALRKAFVEKIIPDNPYDRVKLPPKAKPIIRYYNQEEIGKLFELIKGHHLELAFKMLAYYGFRRSELVGLKWKAIDFDHDTISISHKVVMVKKVLHNVDKLKSKSSNRTLPLMPNLKKHLLTYKEKIEENRKYFGDGYIEKWSEYVFVNDIGDLIKPDHISKSFFDLIAITNLPKIRLHDLRHSCASLLLANGVNMKQIQDWLGHADFSTTANVYSHLDFTTKIQSAKTIYNALDFNRDAEKKDTSDKLSSIKALYHEMQKNGFTDVDDYIEYLQEKNTSQFNTSEKSSRKKEDFEM